MSKFLVVFVFAVMASGVFGMSNQRFGPDSEANSGVPLRRNTNLFTDDDFLECLVDDAFNRGAIEDSAKILADLMKGAPDRMYEQTAEKIKRLIYSAVKSKYKNSQNAESIFGNSNVKSGCSSSKDSRRPACGLNNRNRQEWEKGTSFDTQDPHFNLSGFGNPKIEDYIENEKPDNMVVVELKNVRSADEASRFLSRLQSSIRNGNISKIATLLKKEPGVSIEYVLIYAAEYGILNVVKWAIDQNADVHAIDAFGNTALIAAVKFDHFSVVKYLVEHGANVNVQNNDGDTPVQLAGKNKNREMVKFLIESIKPATAA